MVIWVTTKMIFLLSENSVCNFFIHAVSNQTNKPMLVAEPLYTRYQKHPELKVLIGEIIIPGSPQN